MLDFLPAAVCVRASENCLDREESVLRAQENQDWLWESACGRLWQCLESLMRSWTDGLIVSYTWNCSLGLSKGECLVKPHALGTCQKGYILREGVTGLEMDQLFPAMKSGLRSSQSLKMNWNYSRLQCCYLTANVNSLWKKWTSSQVSNHLYNIPYEVSTLKTASSRERRWSQSQTYKLALDYGYHTYI